MDIKINNYTWAIQVVSGDIEKMNPTEDCYNAGLTEYAEQIISIRQGMSRERTRSTVIHELVHAFLDSYGYTTNCLTEEEAADFFGSQADAIMELTEQIMKGVNFDADNG